MPVDATNRPDPDALLALANKAGRGRLKIFLGASPGVGKTYAMLAAAREQKAAGIDVVCGLIESHGRRETEAMVEGFETIARQLVVYRNRAVPEFDLDAALARRPALLLVDELAHTNVPGSRHPKRWMDVKELLAAGIDVWTTLNVQHLDSLNDVVLKITKVRVRETVPDKVFEAADEVVLVDLPPDELLKRLAEGKVYVQETAAQAVQSFFKPQNLTALRELALRRTAETVDAALIERMRAGAIEGPWPAGERILALVGPDPLSPFVVRQAKRLADTMDAPWTAVSVERPTDVLAEAKRRRLDETLELAKDLGADTERLVGADIPSEILRYARRENVTQIVVGRSTGGRLAVLFGRALAQELVRQAADIGVHVVTATPERLEPPAPRAKPEPSRFWPYLGSTTLVGLAVMFGEAIGGNATMPNLSLVFLAAVVGAAVAFGRWPAIVASALSFVSYNYFFIEPIYTLTVAQPHELLALFVFLAVSVLVSTLAGRVRDQARIASDRMRATRRLYDFSRRISGIASLDEVAEAAASDMHGALARNVVILLEQDGDIALTGMWPPVDELDAASMAAARWAHEHDEPAGAKTQTLPTAPWLFVPLKTPRARVGVIGISAAADGVPLDPEARSLFDTLAEQTAAALERAALSREMGTVKAAAETERVRNTLLASISHDFRTPLASILGASTTLIAFGDRMANATRADMLAQIKEEAEHLDRMVRDLLAITRVEAGGLELRRDWLDPRETADRVVIAARRRAPGRIIEVTGTAPLVEADATLIEQALSNIVENALRHGGPEARVVVAVRGTEGRVLIQVTDDGAGIAAEALPHVFEKFASAGAPDRRDGGESTGLGLAIAKGIVEAHGGTIEAESPVDGSSGARFTIALPRPAERDVEQP